MAASTLTAQDLRRLIAERHNIGAPLKGGHPSSEWALFFELRNGTGFRAGTRDRYIDAFALNLYPSKKHWRVAYEIKVSRSDFLHELKNPQKREWAYEISNEFWFACAPGVAKPEEIPEGCGLLVVNGSKLKRVVAARQREARPLDMTEMAAIARKSLDADALRNTKWRYAGCELDEAALDELVTQHWDQARDDHYRQQAQAWFENKVQGLAAAVETTRAVLAEAGLPPIPGLADLHRVLTDPHGYVPRGSLSSAREWVRAHVSPGPNAQDLAAAIEEHSRTTRDLERLQASTQRAMDAMGLQLAAMGAALRRQVSVTAGGPPEPVLSAGILGLGPTDKTMPPETSGGMNSQA